MLFHSPASWHFSLFAHQYAVEGVTVLSMLGRCLAHYNPNALEIYLFSGLVCPYCNCEPERQALALTIMFCVCMSGLLVVVIL
jgi:hypothetical protein